MNETFSLIRGVSERAAQLLERIKKRNGMVDKSHIKDLLEDYDDHKSIKNSNEFKDRIKILQARMNNSFGNRLIDK